MIDTKHLCFAELALLVLFLFELLEFQVAAEASDDHDLVVVVEDGGVGLGLESALLKLRELLLAAFLGDALLLFFQFAFEVAREFFTLAAYGGCDVFVLLGLVELGFEGVLLLFFLDVLLLFEIELLFGCWVAHVFR